MMFEVKCDTISMKTIVVLLGADLLVEPDSSFNRQDICSRMVSTRMWMEPKARAPGARQRYTNVTAMKHSYTMHVYPRSRTSNEHPTGPVISRLAFGALLFSELIMVVIGRRQPPVAQTSLPNICRRARNPAQPLNQSGYKLLMLPARRLHPFGVSCYQSCLSGRLIGLTIK